MTEQQYKDLLIATAKMSDYEHKDEVVEALKVASVSFQKEWAFTYHLPDHNRETAKTFAEEFVKMRRDAELSMLWLDF